MSNNTVQSVYEVIKFDAVGSQLSAHPNKNQRNKNCNLLLYYLELTYIGCTLPSLMFMNLSAAILANNLFILIGGPVTQAFPSVQLCATVAINFVCTSFSWLNSCGCPLCHSKWPKDFIKHGN